MVAMRHLCCTAVLAALAACDVGDSTPRQAGSNDTPAPDASSNVNTPAAPDAAAPAADAGPQLTPEQQKLQAFGKCMTQADWDANNLGTLALTQTQPNNATCASCHSGGAGGNYLSQDSATTFNMIKTLPYVGKYAQVDAQLNLSQNLVLVNNGQAGSGHPVTYTLPQALVTGLAAFYNATKTRHDANAGNCPQQ
jgi:hypothetical protein